MASVVTVGRRTVSPQGLGSILTHGNNQKTINWMPYVIDMKRLGPDPSGVAKIEDVYDE